MARAEPLGDGVVFGAIGSTLDCVPDPAVLIDDAFRIVASNSAYCDRYCGGESVIGRRCHEVFHRHRRPCHEHGESCPLIAARVDGEPHQAVHRHFTAHGPRFHDITVKPVTDREGRRYYVESIRPVVGASCGTGPGDLVGQSRAFAAMLELVARAAPSDITVLLLGESGSGKELVARAVHEGSDRSDRPFVPLDCSGITETLFESELFGHEQGAFTGAARRKRGLVDVAACGTLFLDEVGDIPSPLQVKLLRLLDTGLYRRVGGTELLRADFRLVCATHRDLADLVATGAFRSDLYYRISAFPIPVPPLRERRSDLPILVDSLWRRLTGGAPRMTPETMACLQRYDYPGNVRELLNILERARILSNGYLVRPEHLPSSCRDSTASTASPLPEEIEPLDEVIDRYLHWACARHDGSRRELASRLGVSERTLYRKLRRCGDRSRSATVGASVTL